jgi:hypothetical protein
MSLLCRLLRAEHFTPITPICLERYDRITLLSLACLLLSLVACLLLHVCHLGVIFSPLLFSSLLPPLHLFLE